MIYQCFHFYRNRRKFFEQKNDPTFHMKKIFVKTEKFFVEIDDKKKR